jgi:hypothetical protein
MNMATEENVKEYLAHWFQLGKKLLSEKRASTHFAQIYFSSRPLLARI